MHYFSDLTAPPGTYRAVSDGENLLGLWKHGQKYFCPGIFDAAPASPDMRIHARVATWLEEYFDGARPKISDLPISICGSAFRRIVLSILCEIPYGEVVTYGEIAKRAAMEMNVPAMSAQAVGGAVGHNPISIVIPCHRVVGSNGSLVGYAGGTLTKLELLKHEGVLLSRLSVPRKGTAL